MTTTPHGPADPHGQPAKETPKTSGVKIGLAALIAFVVFCILYAMFKPSNDSSNDHNNNQTERNDQRQNSAPVVMEERIHVEFTGTYGTTVDIPAGKLISYQKVTTKYCMKNANGDEFCSQNTEDMSDRIGITTGNKQQMFKSQDGSSGSLDLVLTPNYSK